MIKKSNELRIKDEPNLKGGNGIVKFINFLEEEESNRVGRLFSLSTIPVGCSIGYHKHTGDNEIFYFLRGTAKVSDNGKEHLLYPGDCMVCYDGDSHGIENIGDCDLEFIALILYSEQKKQ